MENKSTVLQRVGPADIAEALREHAERIAEYKTFEVKTITEAEAFRVASDMLGGVKSTIKALDTLRTELKAPSLDEGKRIDGSFREPLDMLKGLQKKLETGMNDWGLAEARRKEEAERKRREEEAAILKAEEERLLKAAEEEEKAAAIARENGDVKMTVQTEAMSSIALNQAVAVSEDIQKLNDKPVHGVARTLGGDGSMSTSKVWAFEIVDGGKVPREFCEPVDMLINKAVKSGVRDIPGVRIYEKAKFMNR